MQYDQFIASKSKRVAASGFEADEIGDALFPFQADITRWALARGKAAVFADCGLGKTIMQLEWAKCVHEYTGQDVMIVAPLAVGRQTAAEAGKFGYEVNLVREPEDWKPGVCVTNYERASRFDIGSLGGIVLDESSILKSFTGRFREDLTAAARTVPYRLCATATPAPNDHMELGNHAEFLGVCSAVEMLAEYFVHDGGETSKWALKGHAEKPFWRWVCSWAVALRSPADVGHDGSRFVLPPLSASVVHVESPVASGSLFATEAGSLTERRAARKDSLSARVERTRSIVAASPSEQFVVWCELNAEGDALEREIPEAVQVSGSDDPDVKAAKFESFANGTARVLVTKPKIGGFGLNWQHCANMIFCGLSDSYESYYQSIRRCWRFGQKRPVSVTIIVSEAEDSVVRNVMRKERDADAMSSAMVSAMREGWAGGAKHERAAYATGVASGPGWEMRLGDCVESVRSIPDESVHMSIFSPPFASLYTYSDSDRDMGNCRTHEEFFDHFRYLIGELHRVTKPGRIAAVHCMNLPTSKFRDGVIGLTDFRGEIIRSFSAAGWIYHSEVTIWKDPVTAMQRTKALGLLYKQLRKDSCRSRQGIPDYLVVFRKDGENAEPVEHTHESFPVDRWQQWASPVWMDVNASRTLQAASAREDKDERHICPLQLDVIERALTMWSNRGDTILSPFAGIGSEGYESVRLGRKFIGLELKRSYYEQACRNLTEAVAKTKQRSFFEEDTCST